MEKEHPAKLKPWQTKSCTHKHGIGFMTLDTIKLLTDEDIDGTSQVGNRRQVLIHALLTFFCLFCSMMENPFVTSPAMLPSLGQKVRTEFMSVQKLLVLIPS